MSASQPVTKFQANVEADIEFVRAHCESLNAMLITMHGALSEIVKCEMSLQGSIQMKSIAEIGLCETQAIGLSLGIQNFVKNYGGQENA